MFAVALDEVVDELTSIGPSYLMLLQVDGGYGYEHRD